jgi:hypothetical protein
MGKGPSGRPPSFAIAIGSGTMATTRGTGIDYLDVCFGTG